jgi:hypothetical protein
MNAGRCSGEFRSSILPRTGLHRPLGDLGRLDLEQPWRDRVALSDSPIAKGSLSSWSRLSCWNWRIFCS